MSETTKFVKRELGQNLPHTELARFEHVSVVAEQELYQIARRRLVHKVAD